MAIELGLDLAVDLGRHRRRLAGLAFQGGPLPFGHEPLADAGDRVQVHAQGIGDLGAGPLAPGPVVVAQEQDLGVADLLGRGPAVARDLLQRQPLLGVEPDRV